MVVYTFVPKYPVYFLLFKNTEIVICIDTGNPYIVQTYVLWSLYRQTGSRGAIDKKYLKSKLQDTTWDILPWYLEKPERDWKLEQQWI